MVTATSLPSPLPAAHASHASPAASASVKIPTDWLREPRFAKRSDLYDARKLEMKQLALDKTRRSPYFDQKFARTEAIFRDSYRKSGVQDVLNKAAVVDPSEFHARAIASVSPTRAVLLDRRVSQKRLESLKFEPPEILRLMDIPKPGAPELENWWTKVDGYVEDPTPMIKSSLRLQLSPQRGLLGPVDPAKERSPASVDERRRLKQTKAQLADKVTHISHAVPCDYQCADRVDASVIIRADDLYAQERRHPGSGEGSRSDSSSLAFPMSPIKPTTLRSPKRSHRHIENLFIESTNQRALLDQIKASSPLRPSPHQSPPPPSSSSIAHSPSSFPLPDSPGDGKMNQVKGCRGSIRCGGFS